MRLFPEDKILVCSSSNTSADNIALELLDLKKYVKKLDILRIYAKNQEIIKRHVLLDDISYHKLIKKEVNRDYDFGGRNKLIEEKSKSLEKISFNDALLLMTSRFAILSKDITDLKHSIYFCNSFSSSSSFVILCSML